MPLFPELTLIIVFSASLIVYLLLQFFNSRPGYKEKKSYLLNKYKKLRVKSLALQQSLNLHILSGDHFKEPFAEGMTFGEYLKHLQKNHIQNLSDKGYAKIKNSDNRVQQKKVADMLKEQENKLKDAEKKLSNFNVVANKP